MKIEVVLLRHIKNRLTTVPVQHRFEKNLSPARQLIWMIMKRQSYGFYPPERSTLNELKRGFMLKTRWEM